MEFSLLAVFMIGMFSAPHCLGMCGGIIGALSLSLPPEIRRNRSRILPIVLSYNLGRVSSYSLAGALVGAVGNHVLGSLSPQFGHTVIQWVAAAFMVGMGLYVAGWFPRFAVMESVGRPLWRALEPIGKRLLPVKNPFQALILGLIWGWLPCGLVYTILISAGAAGSATQGALYMLAFGLGTLPMVSAAGLLTDLLTKLGRTPIARRGAGLVIIALALASVLMNPSGDHAQHVHDVHMHNQ